VASAALLVLAGRSLPAQAAAQEAARAPEHVAPTAGVDSLLSASRRASGAPGVAVAVTVGGTPILERADGTADLSPAAGSRRAAASSRRGASSHPRGRDVSRRFLRTAGSALPLALASTRPAPAQPADGVQYTFRLSSHEVDAKGRRTEAPPFVARVEVAGDRFRADVVSGRDGFEAGDYVLGDGDGTRLLVVSPRRREYRELHAAALHRLATRRVRVTVEEPRVALTTAHDEGATAPTAPTRRVRVERSFGLHARVLLLSQRSRVVERTDYWVRDEGAEVANPLLAWFLATMRAPGAGDARLTEDTRSAERPLRGRVLRSHTRVLVEGRGGREVLEATSHLEDVRRGPVDAGRLRIPSDHRRAEP
jgi:hypothetical protein